MGDSPSLAQQFGPDVSQIVCELIRRAESFAIQGLSGEANSAFHAAIVADDTPHARLAYAAHLTSHGRWATAELQLRSALEIAHARGMNVECCACCLALATVCALQGNQAIEFSWLQQAIRWQLADRGELCADVLQHLGLHAIRTRRLAEARRYLSSAETIADDEELASIRLHLAILDWLEGAERRALDRLTEAHRAFRAADDLEGCAFALINSGHILQDIECGREAAHCFEQAERIFDALGQKLRAQRMRGFRREAVDVTAQRAEAYLSN